MKGARILDAVGSPADLKVLTDEELAILAQEIREEIISVTSRTGGHVASSLGTVETILAVHSLIDSPRDRFVFDVGHQAYAHKLVTGRLDRFSTLRQFGGISGFLRPDESPHDVHPTGHASDSLSMALGLALARDLRGTDEKVVALIGDASLAGGMAFEALNTIGQAQTPMLIILNDNEMSISRGVGALMKHLGNMRASAQYRHTRDAMQDRLENSGQAGRALVSIGRTMKDSMKQLLIPQAMIFEKFGILCTAPINGHDIAALRDTLRTLLPTDVPVLMHVVTKKGFGYEPAVRDPERFHGIGPYDVATGASVKKAEPSAPTFTDAFGAAIVAEARRDPDIVAITAAMKGGTGLASFAAEFPDRFIDAGIAEGHAVGMAAGLAKGGKKPVVAIYSTFLQRAFDQMIVDVALPKANVVFCIDRAGIVGEDGSTHHGMFDMAYARMIPHLRVLAPSNEAELACAFRTALALGGPFAIRYPRGAAAGIDVPAEPRVFEVGKSSTVREGSDVAILAFGKEVDCALEAADELAEGGIEARVVDMRWVKPIDAAAVREAAETRLVVTVEDGVLAGGAGSAVLEEIARQGLSAPVECIGIDDAFVVHGAQAVVRSELGLDGSGVAARVRARLADL